MITFKLDLKEEQAKKIKIQLESNTLWIKKVKMVND
jgi:hypothetical protein